MVLLSLEGAIKTWKIHFKKGLEMVVDGIAAEQIQEIMENEIYGIEERHRIGSSIFKTAGTSSPTLGVLGAVIGLIGALGNLEDVEALGHMISSCLRGNSLWYFLPVMFCSFL